MFGSDLISNNFLEILRTSILKQKKQLLEVFFLKKDVLRNFAKFTGKLLC